MRRIHSPSSLFGTAVPTNIQLSNPGSANTKGSWVELTSSTSRNTNRLLVTAGRSTIFRDYLIDIGIGGSGSESTIIQNIPVSEFDDLSLMAFDFPLTIAQGSRMAARHQVSGTTGVLAVGIYPYYCAGQLGSSAIYTYGADTTNSRGTEIDPGTTANTKGSWAEITSSTSQNHSQWWIALPGRGTSRGTVRYALDIGIGGSGSEVIIFPDICSFTFSVGDAFSPAFYGPFFLPIPSGTRIAARATTNTNSLTSPSRLLGVVLFGA